MAVVVAVVVVIVVVVWCSVVAFVAVIVVVVAVVVIVVVVVRLNVRKWSEHGLRDVHHARTARTFSTSQLPKVVRERCVLHILTWKYASHHNGVHFFNVTTSKRGLRRSVFNTFDFEMCFAPKRRPFWEI